MRTGGRDGEWEQNSVLSARKKCNFITKVILNSSKYIISPRLSTPPIIHCQKNKRDRKAYIHRDRATSTNILSGFHTGNV